MQMIGNVMGQLNRVCREGKRSQGCKITRWCDQIRKVAVMGWSRMVQDRADQGLRHK